MKYMFEYWNILEVFNESFKDFNVVKALLLWKNLIRHIIVLSRIFFYCHLLKYLSICLLTLRNWSHVSVLSKCMCQQESQSSLLNISCVAAIVRTKLSMSTWKSQFHPHDAIVETLSASLFFSFDVSFHLLKLWLDPCTLRKSESNFLTGVGHTMAIWTYGGKLGVCQVGKWACSQVVVFCCIKYWLVTISNNFWQRLVIKALNRIWVFCQLNLSS